MISTVSHPLSRIAWRRPNRGSVVLALALGAPTRCGEPVRASWLGWAGALFGSFASEALFSGLFSTLTALSGKLCAILPSAYPSFTLNLVKPLNDLGKSVMHNVANLGGGNQPSDELGASMLERALGQTSIIRRTIQSGQRRSIPALS
jgi:hypothetical protein